MLTIRNAQLRAFADDDHREHRRAVVDVLRYKYPDALGGVPDDYVDGVAGLAMTTCLENGFDQGGVIIDFADALVKDDQHPLSADALEAKRARVLRELRAREVFMRLRAIADAAAASGASGGAADDDAEHANEEP